MIAVSWTRKIPRFPMPVWPWNRALLKDGCGHDEPDGHESSGDEDADGGIVLFGQLLIDVEGDNHTEDLVGDDQNDDSQKAVEQASEDFEESVHGCTPKGMDSGICLEGNSDLEAGTHYHARSDLSSQGIFLMFLLDRVEKDCIFAPKNWTRRKAFQKLKFRSNQVDKGKK